MKYTIEIEINAPRDQVIKLFDNPENMKHWQEGLLSYEPLTGTPGQEGATAKLVYRMGKKEMVLIEHVLTRNLPEAFHGTYDTKGVHNIQKNYFEEINENTTRWKSISEFYFSGFMMKTIGFLMPGAFQKQSKKYMQDFKNFAEKGISVATPL